MLINTEHRAVFVPGRVLTGGLKKVQWRAHSLVLFALDQVQRKKFSESIDRSSESITLPCACLGVWAGVKQFKVQIYVLWYFLRWIQEKNKTRLLFSTHGFAGWSVDDKRLNWWGAGSRSERTQWTSITLLRVDWSCLRMRNDGLSLSMEERHLRVGKRGVLAASQKAAEVETSTEPLLFEPRCAHRSEMLFRHTAVLFAVILHQTKRRGLCSCLASAHLLGNLHSIRLLSQRLWTRYQPGC